MRIVPRQRQDDIPLPTQLSVAVSELIYQNQPGEYHEQHGMPPNRFPSLDKQPLDLYKLKKAVEDRGGLQTVRKEKKWAEIGRDLGYSGQIVSSLPTSLEHPYQQWIHLYEEWCGNNGSGVDEEIGA